MSLILATRFKDGILLASDPFFFDNDGEVPLKGIKFDKFIISEQHHCVMFGIGSVWVLEQAGKWLALRKPDFATLLPELALKWKELNRVWKKNRTVEITQAEIQSLRPISDSLFLFAKSDDLSTIHICDSEGKLHTTTTFVLSGSGSDLARQLLEATGQKFSPTDSLESCLDLTWKCFRAASYDLYVIGYPAIVLLSKYRIINLAKQCKVLWDRNGKSYFDSLSLSAVESLGEE